MDLPPLHYKYKFERIEEEEVLKFVKSLGVNKAVCLDCIGARLLKKTTPAISHSLTSLFNYSLQIGGVASTLMLVKVTPVPKIRNSGGQ